MLDATAFDRGRLLYQVPPMTRTESENVRALIEKYAATEPELDAELIAEMLGLTNGKGETP